ncbi:Tfp pilus assembly protein PilF [Rheinheimera pacifica]|uniref:tetratricopeptide repeat protein n=1 Tax=Rheinheimera pacifica TaxID=173990 RepID=UPI00285F79E4|nr:hypothetical protein [Rheinheimera pacifica]MDR6984047.1 Tfp pilus assembly protein PilF [Rheinheimera pacifica]
MKQPLAESLAAIKVLVRDGSIDEATRQADTLITDHPKSLPLLMVRALIDEKTDDKDAASKRYKAIVEAFPLVSQPVVSLCRLAIQEQSFEDAQGYLSKLIELDCPPQQILRLKVSLAQQQKDQPAEKAALLELVTILEKPEEKTLARLASLYLKSSQFDLLRDIVDRSLLIYPESDLFILYRLKLAENEGDAQSAIMFCQQLVTKEPLQVKWIVTLLKLLVHAGESEQAERVVRSALDNNLASAQLCSVASTMLLPSDMKQRLLSWAEAVNEQSTPADQIAAADVLLNLSGLAIADLTSDSASGSATAATLAQFNAPTDTELKRPLLQDKMEEVTITQSPTADTIVIVFTGLANRTGMPLAILDRYFAKLNVSTVYLRDPTRLLFNNGVSALGNCFDTSIEYLQDIITASGASKVVTFGISAGGFAAIRYGLALKADLILGFGAAINLNADFLKDDGRAKIIVKRLQGLPANVRDLKPLMQASAGDIPIHLYYCEHMSQDSLHAKHVQNVSGVVLHELKNEKEHNVLGFLAEKGNLLDELSMHLNFIKKTNPNYI